MARAPDGVSPAAPDPGGSGRVVALTFDGASSGLRRPGYVYLPPQYSEPAFAHSRFTVLELLHGEPGRADSWVYGLQIKHVMDSLIDAGTIGPMVVVMPTTYEGKGYDCVNVPDGEQDDTYLSTDVPADVVHKFRVLTAGEYWAIGGLSDGGFCAANLALRHPGRFTAVASMDGFYSPYGDRAVLSRIFPVGSAQWRANDPTQLIDAGHLPHFWLMSGTDYHPDMRAATAFYDAVTKREPAAWLIVQGATHTTPAWRAAMPRLVRWTWSAVSGASVASGITTIPL